MELKNSSLTVTGGEVAEGKCLEQLNGVFVFTSNFGMGVLVCFEWSQLLKCTI
jgi:hypothetical protein